MDVLHITQVLYHFCSLMLFYWEIFLFLYKALLLLPVILRITSTVLAAIIQINAGILLIRDKETNSSEISSENHTFPFKKMPLKMSSAKLRSFCLDFNMVICPGVCGGLVWYGYVINLICIHVTDLRIFHKNKLPLKSPDTVHYSFHVQI